MKKIVLLLLILLLENSQVIFGQEKRIKRSSIRTLPLIAPTALMGIVDIPLSYEYFIKENRSIEFTAFRFVFWNEMRVLNPTIGFFAGIRFYRSDKRTKTIQFWWSPYVNYFTNYKNKLTHGKHQFFGVGISAGVRCHFGKSKTWFMDGGMGLSLNYAIYSNYYIGTNTIYYPYPLPRPTLMIGKKF